MGWARPPRVLPETPPLTDDTPPPHEAYGLSKALGDESAHRMRVIGPRRLRAASRTSSSGKCLTTCHGRTQMVYHYYSGRESHETTSSTRTPSPRRRPRRSCSTGAEPRYTNLFVAAASTRFAEPTADLLAGGARAPAFRGASNDSILDASRATRRGPGGRGAGVEASRRRRPSRRATILFEYLDIGGFEPDSGATPPQHAQLAYRFFPTARVRSATDASAPCTRSPRPTGGMPTAFGEDATVVAVNMLGTRFPPGDGGYPYPVSVDDNARLQKKLVDDVLRAATPLAHGYSMGGMQALAFARLFPEAAARVMCVRGGGLRGLQRRVFEARLPCWRAMDGGDAPGFGTVYAGWGSATTSTATGLPPAASRPVSSAVVVGGFARDDPDDLWAMVRTRRRAARASPGLENIARAPGSLPRRYPRASASRKSPSSRNESCRRAPWRRPTATAPATRSGPAWSPSDGLGAVSQFRCGGQLPILHGSYKLRLQVQQRVRRLAPVPRGPSSALSGCSIRRSLRCISDTPRGSRHRPPTSLKPKARVSSSPEAHERLQNSHFAMRIKKSLAWRVNR